MFRIGENRENGVNNVSVRDTPFYFAPSLFAPYVHVCSFLNDIVLLYLAHMPMLYTAIL